MTLSPGTRLGPYEITAAVGAGGMGEVYRARDTRLDRSVAVKILPSEFAQNTQLKLRFEREARTISQLEHPNICRLYDVGDDYLVMELLDGETLTDRIARGPIPIDDVLRHGIEIAEALDKAHHHGVVHRDLKPGNVMVTRSGAKLLDFGLARTADVAVVHDAMTIAKPITQEGAIVGTVQYMAPEQLEGANADHRTDLFALGAVLYEMATGRRAFQGSTKTSLIAAIVASQPAPVAQVQPLAPATLEHVIQRCLAKDPDQRWQSARDVAEELKWIRESASHTPALAARKTREKLAWSAAVLALLAAGAVAMYYATRPLKRVVTAIVPPVNARFDVETSTAVLAPDAHAVAFLAGPVGERPSLWVHDLSSGVAERLPGTDGAMFPFWSPDGRWIAFFSDGFLKRTDASGGPIERIAPASSGRGGAWSSRNEIVFSPSTGDALFLVPAAGGKARLVTSLDRDTSHRFPAFLPDAVHFLFFKQGPAGEEPNVFVGSTDGRPARPLLRSDGGVVWSDTGHIFFVRDGVLRARPFDPRSLEFEGDAVSLAENVQTHVNLNFANVSAAKGSLTYVTGNFTSTSTLAWFARDGKELETILPAATYFDPRLSPDGRLLAYAGTVGSGALNLFVYDLERRVSSRFTFGSVNEWAPVWSPDGKWIAYTSFEDSRGDIYLKAASGSGGEQKLLSDNRRKIVSEWTRDGTVLYHVMNPHTGWDIMTYSLRDRRSQPFLTTPHQEAAARVSPDGRWVAYASSESGQYQVYVRGFGPQAHAGKWQVSANGGQTPSWSSDGTEIYYVGVDHQLYGVSVRERDGALAVGVPLIVLPVSIRQFAGLSRAQYATADGRRFVANTVAEERGTPAVVTMVQNWESGKQSRYDPQP
jgi:eukaryotic-like serine/threonine-protein kinase